MADIQLNNTPGYGDPYNVLVIGDSRVRKLDQFIRREATEHRSTPGLNFEVIAKPGGKINQCITEALQYRLVNRYHQVYLMAGVCDLSSKRGKKLYPYDHCDETPNLVSYYQTNFQTAYNRLAPITDCPIICDVIGMDFKMYNKSQYEDDVLQDVVDEAIPQVNNWLHAFMKSKPLHACSPYYAHYVYKRRNNRTSCRYSKATIDGLHYTDYYLSFIAKEIIKSTKKNKITVHPNSFNMREDDYIDED